MTVSAQRSERIDVRSLTKVELIELLQAEGKLQQQLFQQAREVRQEYGADEVTLRGVIEVSNFCQKNCNYCAMRASNANLDRYRLSAEDLLVLANQIKQANIGIFFLQAGQDPHYDAVIAEVIPEIKQKLKMQVLLCLGERPREVYEKWAQLGADSYILKFETSNPQLYREIAYTPLSKRVQCIRTLQELGYKVGTGNIVGLPNQTLDMLAEDILLALEIEPNFVSSSPFIPNQDTPFESLDYGNLNITLNTMAIYRIAFKNCLVPSISALEKIQKGGQLMGLNAGANVMTINFTPTDFQDKYAIYSKKRFVVSLEHALNTIKQAGLRVRHFDFGF